MPGAVNNYLLKEHNLISDFLLLFKKERDFLRSGHLPDQNRIEIMISFCRDFADKVHHAKEENILFPEIYPIENIEGGPHCIYYKELELQRPPVLERIQESYQKMGLDEQTMKKQWREITRQGHILNPLLEEHILGRTLLKQIDYEVAQCLRGKSSNNNELVYAMYSYASMLEEHIEKENTCFANTVDKYLSDSVQAKIVEAFEAIDRGANAELIRCSLENLEALKKM